jgi:hypothetical protein
MKRDVYVTTERYQHQLVDSAAPGSENTTLKCCTIVCPGAVAAGGTPSRASLKLNKLLKA